MVSFVIARGMLAPEPVEYVAHSTVISVTQRPAQTTAPAEVNSGPGREVAVPAVAPGVRVLLRCEGTTWVEATPAGAEQRRYELGPGQNLEITARERLALTLGDAGVIRIMVNGRELGFIGYKGETKAGLSFTAPKAPPAGAIHSAEGD